MTTKLKIHSLSENRPLSSDAQLQIFFKIDGGAHLHYGGLQAADSAYIQIPNGGDCNRFYVDPREVADFLLNHDLLEVPGLVDHEAEAYTEACAQWFVSPARGCGYTAYSNVRRAFIQANVEAKGFTFKPEKYFTLC